MEIVLKKFSELTNLELYGLLKLRTDVFVVEQHCPYPELDGADVDAVHGMAILDEELVGCFRVLPETPKRPVAIGRVAVRQDHRAKGIAHRLMEEAVSYTEKTGKEEVYLQAQAHLVDFYASFGFKEESDTYLEDGIPHVDMRLKKSVTKR